MSDCVLKTLACQVLHAGPSKSKQKTESMEGVGRGRLGKPGKVQACFNISPPLTGDKVCPKLLQIKIGESAGTLGEYGRSL